MQTDCASRRLFLQGLAGGVVVAASGAVAAADAARAADESPAPGTDAGPSIADTIVQFAQSLRYEDLPEPVVQRVKRTILDTLGCAIAGYQTGPSQIAVKLAAQVSSKPGATVICAGFNSSPDRATFANGVMIRNLDFNDAYSTPVGGGHPSDSLAALLAAAEVAGRSGRDLILATAITYEVFCKLSDVLDIKSAGLDQSTVLGIGSLVGAGSLLGHNREQMLNAIGITVGGNTAINQGRVGTLSNWKDYATAEASRKAIFSAQLALAGMTGPREIFEGPSGFFRVILRKSVQLPPLGEPYGILRASTKRFALGQYSQSVAEAAAQIRSSFKSPDEIEEVNVHVSHNAMRVMAGSADKWHPTSHETADHSMPYATAVILMYGTIDDHYYDDPYLHDSKLLTLVNRVHCFASAEADAREKDFNLCDLEVVLKSGDRKSVRVEYHRGHWRNPMNDAEMGDKFRSLARRQLSAEKTEALLQRLWDLDKLPKAAALAQMTRV